MFVLGWLVLEGSPLGRAAVGTDPGRRGTLTTVAVRGVHRGSLLLVLPGEGGVLGVRSVVVRKQGHKEMCETFLAGQSNKHTRMSNAERAPQKLCFYNQRTVIKRKHVKRESKLRD